MRPHSIAATEFAFLEGVSKEWNIINICMEEIAQLMMSASICSDTVGTSVRMLREISFLPK